MLVDEKNILLEAGVEMRLQTKFPDNGIVMTVDVCIDTVHSLEDLADECWERLGKGHT